MNTLNQNFKIKSYKHLKTGNIYTAYDKKIINATNGENDGQIMVLYFNQDGEHFVREESEFNEKFKLESHLVTSTSSNISVV